VNFDIACDQHPFPETCGASVLSFKGNVLEFYKEPQATLDLSETNALLSDEQGNMLLHSNGMTIHGMDHQPITNGDTISYGDQWERGTDQGETVGFRISTGAVFIPKPGYSNRYLLLYSNYDGIDSTDFLNKRYADIEVHPDGSVTVLEKDVIFADEVNSVGQLTCAQHANGRDWWLLQNRFDTVLTYLIDPDGINLHHKSVPENPWGYFAQGFTKFDPKGERIAINHILRGADSTGLQLVLADFDRCTGEISNVMTRIDSSYYTSIFGPGLEFSASGQYLYTMNVLKIYQYDTWSDDIFGSRKLVAEYDGHIAYSPAGTVERPTFFDSAQRGPDDKIYLDCSGSNYYFHIIHDPDQPGTDCNVEQHAIRLPTYFFGTVPTFPTLRLGPIDDSACDTLGLDNNPVSRFRYEQDSLDFLDIDFVDLAFYEPTEWYWDFGDGNNSTERFPSHRYDQQGAYEVCLTVSNQNSSDVSCDTLYLGVSSLNESAAPRNISVYPNPVEDVTRVAFHDYLPQAAEFRVFDIQGRLVLNEELDGLAQLVDMRGLTPGLYVYEVWDGDERLTSGKVVKL